MEKTFKIKCDNAIIAPKLEADNEKIDHCRFFVFAGGFRYLRKGRGGRNVTINGTDAQAS